jgi:hypothetical protein
MRLRRIAGSARTLSLLAAAALLTALVIGGAFAIGRSPDSSGRAATAADEQPSLPRTTSNLPQAALTREVRGWPHTTQNAAGEYSWDGRTCAGQWCVHGFMHNGYASGDVDISIRVVSERPDPNDGQTAVNVAEHDGLYRRIGARTEEWIVAIQGTTLAIRLEAEPGASDADLAEAHAIIESMRTRPQDTKLGFRLVFTLTTDDWDSG